MKVETKRPVEYISGEDFGHKIELIHHLSDRCLELLRDLASIGDSAPSAEGRIHVRVDRLSQNARAHQGRASSRLVCD